MSRFDCIVNRLPRDLLDLGGFRQRDECIVIGGGWHGEVWLIFLQISTNAPKTPEKRVQILCDKNEEIINFNLQNVTRVEVLLDSL